MVSFEELNQLNLLDLNREQLQSLLVDLEMLYDSISKEEPPETAEEADIIAWEERLEAIDDRIDDLKDRLEEL